jgi:hypothetical protein
LKESDARVGGYGVLFRQERSGGESDGGKRVCVANRSSKSVRKREQMKRWFPQWPEVAHWM